MNFEVTETFSDLTGKVTGWAEQIILLLPNVIAATLVFLLFYLLGKLIRKTLKKPVRRISSNETLVRLILSSVFIAIVAVGVFTALSMLQLEKTVTSLLAGAGIVGLALGFAFQDIAANFVAGVLINVARPIRVGHVIESSDYFGTVHDINLRNTIIRTPQNKHVYIPNRDIYENPLTNYSNERELRIDLACGISYGDDLDKVEEVSIEAIKSLDYLLDGRPVDLYYNEFGSSSINFVIRYWIDFEKIVEIRKATSDRIKALKKAYDAHDIMIPFPIRTLDFGIKGGEKLDTMVGARGG